MVNGQIEGLITIDRQYFVDRRTVLIKLFKQNHRFFVWLRLGGRSHAVNVQEELDRIAKSVVPASSFVEGRDK